MHKKLTSIGTFEKEKKIMVDMEMPRVNRLNHAPEVEVHNKTPMRYQAKLKTEHVNIPLDLIRLAELQVPGLHR